MEVTTQFPLQNLDFICVTGRDIGLCDRLEHWTVFLFFRLHVVARESNNMEFHKRLR